MSSLQKWWSQHKIQNGSFPSTVFRREEETKFSLTYFNKCHVYNVSSSLSPSIFPSTALLGDRCISTFLTNLHGIMTCPTSLLSACAYSGRISWASGPTRYSSALNRRMFNCLSVPTKVPTKIRSSEITTRRVCRRRVLSRWIGADVVATGGAGGGRDKSGGNEDCSREGSITGRQVLRRCAGEARAVKESSDIAFFWPVSQLWTPSRDLRRCLLFKQDFQALLIHKVSKINCRIARLRNYSSYSFRHRI